MVMAFRHYTRDELIHLRDSPLVQRPDTLHAIEQWIDDAAQQPRNAAPTNKRQPQAKASGDASLMGNFTTGQRPSLLPRASKSAIADDAVLGPPRNMFSNGRNATRAADFGEKPDTTSADEHDGLRSKFFSERQANRKSLNEKDDGIHDSWSTVRERRQLGREEDEGKDRQERYGRRERELDGERRNGLSEKTESRWGERRLNGERTGGWRDRERRRDTEWMSGGTIEKNPEWMDDSAPGGTDDDLGSSIGMAKRAEDFQRWKDERKLKEAQAAAGLTDVESAPIEPAPPAKEALATKSADTLQIDGLVDKSFGGWGESSAGAREGVATPAKATQATAKSKGSRFASMFKDTQVKEEPLPIELMEAKVSLEGHPGTAEDEAGFKRILQMLGNTTVGQQNPLQDGLASPQSRANAQSIRQKSRFTGFFDQTPKSPERVFSPPTGPPGLPRPMEHEYHRDSREIPREDRNGPFGGQLPTYSGEEQNQSRVPSSGVPLDPVFTEHGHREQRPPSGHLGSVFLEHPPSRGGATPDGNIQNLLAGQRSQRPQGPDKNSEFLLNLLQTRGPRPASQPGRPDSNFPLWLEQPAHLPETHAPKPRAPPPPGLFEDQLLQKHPQEVSRSDQNATLPNEQMRPRQPPRAPPPGFFDEQSFMLQQQLQQQQSQRQNYPNSQPQPQQQPNRRMPGPMNPHQMPHQGSQLAQYNGPSPLDFLMSPLGSSAHQPPPPPQMNYNPNIPRHPPGFHPVPFQNPQPPPPLSQQQGQGQGQDRSMSLQSPPGFPAPGMMSPTSPLGMPPGFFNGPNGGGSGNGNGAGVSGVTPGFLAQMRAADAMGPPGLRAGLRGYETGAHEGALGGARP